MLAGAYLGRELAIVEVWSTMYYGSMKTGNVFRVMAAATLASVLMAGLAPGQSFGTSTGGKPGTNDLGGGVGIGLGKLPTQPPKTIRIAITVVGKEREWTNNAGVKIMASLLAFPKPEGADRNTPVEILRDGQIRLMRGEDHENIVPYPLEKLSEDDQEFVSNLALNLRLAADAEREKAEMEAQAKKEKNNAE